jgi:hypothetical protein
VTCTRGQDGGTFSLAPPSKCCPVDSSAGLYIHIYILIIKKCVHINMNIYFERERERDKEKRSRMQVTCTRTRDAAASALPAPSQCCPVNSGIGGAWGHGVDLMLDESKPGSFGQNPGGWAAGDLYSNTRCCVCSANTPTPLI